jgi:chemotaxis protein CheX
MMTLALAPAELKSMVDEIWSSLFQPVPTDADDADMGSDLVVGFVDISGGWLGRVAVETTDAGAVAIASSMLAAEPDTLGDEDLADAIGELANIVGGSVKSCVEGQSTLSLPSVERQSVLRHGTSELMTVTTHWLDHPLRVRVQQIRVVEELVANGARELDAAS